MLLTGEKYLTTTQRTDLHDHDHGLAHDLQTLLTGSTVDPPASPSAEEKLETAAQPIVANGLGLLRDMHVVLSQLFGQVPVQPIA